MVATKKKQNSVTAASLGLLQMEGYTKEQRLFIIQQHFKKPTFNKSFNTKHLISLLLRVQKHQFDIEGKNLTFARIQRFLTNDLYFQAYKVQLTHLLIDHEQKTDFDEWILWINN